MQKTPEVAIDSLFDIVGEEGVIFPSQKEKIQDYLLDMADFPSEPLAIVQPKNTEQVAQIVTYASGTGTPVVARGAGTSLTGASSSHGGLVIDFSKHMNNILKVDAVNWYVHCEAGVVLEDLNEELKKSGFFFPPDPGSSSWCTVGGVISENSGGMRCFRYGTVEDWVLALKVVLADGSVVKLGEPLPKNRVGYDFLHLICGSEGTLAIVTEAWLKIIPIPRNSEEHERMLVFFDNWRDAGNAIRSLRERRVWPVLLEFIDFDSARSVNSSFDLQIPEHEATLFIEADSDVPQIIEICAQNNSVGSYLAKDKADKERLYNARALVYLGIKDKGTGVHTEDIVVPIEKLADCLEFVKKVSKKYNLRIPTNGHAGDGNVHPIILYDKSSKEEIRAAQLAFEEICEHVIEIEGSVTGEHGVGEQKVELARRQLSLHSGEQVIRLMKETKALWDPQGVFNPNKFIVR